MYDLLLKGGVVIDPAANLNGRADVAFANGRVAHVAPDIGTSEARAHRDVSGKAVTPGLIDLHTHVYWGGTAVSVDANMIARRSGTTTFVDAGSAGAANFQGFRSHVIEPSPVRILAYLNISFPGIFGFSRAVMVAEASDIRLLDVAEAVRAAREHSDLVVGIKVRVGRNASEFNGLAALDNALEAADAVNLPVMAHIDFPPPTRAQILERLRAGDVFTHTCRPFPNSALNGRGEIRPEMYAARERGVLFDIGHGMGALDFDVTRTMLDKGFLPDVISSDVHVLSVDGPAYDILVTMSKFLCLGLPLETVIKMSTQAPALAINRPELGTLAEGSPGDATVLSIEDGEYTYVDVVGNTLRGKQALLLDGMVVNGEWWEPEGQINSGASLT